MTKLSDVERVLAQLRLHGGSASNARIRDALGLSAERYDVVRAELITDNKICKVRGRGGGIELTDKGAASANALSPTATKAKESDLYAPYCETLRRDISDDDEAALVINAAKMKLRGQWRNPDVVKISVRRYDLLRANEVVLSSYELKTETGWNLNSAYEAAAHRRFAHYAHLVVPVGQDAETTAFEDLTSVCGRLGVGLTLIRTHYKHFKQEVIIEPLKAAPDLMDVELFTTRLFEHDKEARSKFDALWIS